MKEHKYCWLFPGVFSKLGGISQEVAGKDFVISDSIWHADELIAKDKREY